MEHLSLFGVLPLLFRSGGNKHLLRSKDLRAATISLVYWRRTIDENSWSFGSWTFFGSCQSERASHATTDVLIEHVSEGASTSRCCA